MMSHITNYFKSALLAQKHPIIDFKDSKDTYKIITKEEFEDGIIDVAIADEWVKGENDAIDVLIVPKTIKTVFENAAKITHKIEELTGILYVPATLHKSGELRYSEKVPWIPREFLAPMIDPQLSLGSMDDVDTFLSNTTARRIKISSWEEYIAYIKDFYRAVTSCDFDKDEMNVVDPTLELETSIYIVLDNTINATVNIEQLYDNIAQNEVAKPLYERFIRPRIERSKSLISNRSVEKMQDHKGQMGGEYPLGQSQREAINHFSELKNSEILAVSGPPGTGKTTLLQSIVANMYVKNALEKAKAPIIVAASTNNQAVTNIIDSFGHVTKVGIKNLEERWITGVNSFAVYFPSSNRRESAEEKGYQCTSREGDGFAVQVDSDSNIHQSTEKMIESASHYFNRKIRGIDECRDIIHTELIRIDDEKNKLLSDLHDIRGFTQGKGIPDYIHELDQDIAKCMSDIKELEKKQTEDTNQINLYQHRVDEWYESYKKISFYTRILGKFNIGHQKILSRLKLSMTVEEYQFLENIRNFDDIIDNYSKLVETVRSNVLKIRQQIKEIQKTINGKEKDKQQVLSLRKQVHIRCQQLKEYHCDIYAGKNVNSRDDVIKDFEECILEKINDHIDTNIRYIEFWLAVHYYECRWLLGEASITGKQRGTSYKNVIESLYSRLAMVSPCMVMTFFMLPKYFKVSDKNEKVPSYLYNFIDLLIVDEAGQVSPEIAAASFALAKKAVVVGDEHQIPPVWGIDSALDESLALTYNVIGNNMTFEELIHYGQNCSQSSVMKVASNSCHYNKYDRGLFLSEHRRCYDEIVAYCNELVYSGMLKACRGAGIDDHNYPLSLPHMGYKNIEIRSSKKEGCSRINEKEAEEIANWLSIHYSTIVAAYKGQGKMIEDSEILAIITPFKAQVKILKSALEKSLKDLSKNIDVGTVHTFQGAERKVIILSTVYGSDDGCFFINQNASLMNVAVSRAKDAFWVFGARDCLDKIGRSPSALLRKYVVEEIV